MHERASSEVRGAGGTLFQHQNPPATDAKASMLSEALAHKQCRDMHGYSITYGDRYDVRGGGEAGRDTGAELAAVHACMRRCFPEQQTGRSL